MLQHNVLFIRCVQIYIMPAVCVWVSESPPLTCCFKKMAGASDFSDEERAKKRKLKKSRRNSRDDSDSDGSRRERRRRRKSSTKKSRSSRDDDDDDGGGGGSGSNDDGADDSRRRRSEKKEKKKEKKKTTKKTRGSSASAVRFELVGTEELGLEHEIFGTYMRSAACQEYRGPRVDGGGRASVSFCSASAAAKPAAHPRKKFFFTKGFRLESGRETLVILNGPNERSLPHGPKEAFLFLLSRSSFAQADGKAAWWIADADGTQLFYVDSDQDPPPSTGWRKDRSDLDYDISFQPATACKAADPDDRDDAHSDDDDDDDDAPRGGTCPW